MSRTAAAGAGRVAALDHKAFDDAVENKTVIKAVFGKLDKVINGDGSGGRVELKGHGFSGSHGNYCTHGYISFIRLFEWFW